MPTPTKNPGVIRYTTTIEQSTNPADSWAWVDFPYDLKALYGIGNLVPAIMTFDGLSYQGSIAKMGGQHPMLLIKRDILKQLGKHKGETVAVTVTFDDQPRQIMLPIELKRALDKQPVAKAIHQQLAFSHRREYAQWVAEAKQSTTRERRAAKAVEIIVAKDRTRNE